MKIFWFTPSARNEHQNSPFHAVISKLIERVKQTVHGYDSPDGQTFVLFFSFLTPYTNRYELMVWVDMVVL